MYGNYFESRSIQLNKCLILSGYLPSRLPTSCLTVAPRFNPQTIVAQPIKRPALTEVNNGENGKLITKPYSGKLQTVPESDVPQETAIEHEKFGKGNYSK